MNTILKKFISEPLFEACAALLEHLHIQFNNDVTRTPVSFESLYPMPLTKALQAVLPKVERTYFIGTVDEASLSGHAEDKDIDDVTSQAAEGRYAGMMIFAVDVYGGESLTRTEMATLTRGFNRIAAAQPVILFIRQGKQLALATCERSDYTQQWRDGEKLGKVSILRGINCEHPHRGHIDILESIGDKPYPTFEELYKHWMQVFSSELLTKKFYTELQNWYFWAVRNVEYPNDIDDDNDDTKYNNENVIRLITRLMFVWFLKQKNLVNPDLFDVEKLRGILKNFDESSGESNYYVGIIQNLFFATLNQEVANRKFMGKWDPNHHGIKTLFRNKKLFVNEGNEEEIIRLFNQSPYVNGSLFECLDNKERNGKTFCWDGFSECKTTKEGKLKQAVIPNYLFFAGEGATEVDMREEYGKASAYIVRVSGLITILNKYYFTIEENTPLDEDVALDPELLGQVFENLLGAFNPETQTTARKNTGSYYTPRNIVNYMVKESILAYLKGQCPEIDEAILESLVNYHEVQKPDNISETQTRQIVTAIYHCRILDPACGSGAFPIGALQLLVHMLRKLDDANKYWYKVVLEQALEEVKLMGAEAEEEKARRSAEIEKVFQEKVDDPDYTRKLYIIEKCIFGVDIQTIAVQISRLRCFISLLCEQNATTDATTNYGIKPLPNLETNFVAANTLRSLELSKEEETLLREDEVSPLISRLREVRHLLFMPRDNQAKKRLKEQDKKLREQIDQKIQEIYNRRLAEKVAFVEKSISEIEVKLRTLGDRFEKDQTIMVTEYDAFGMPTVKEVKKANPKTVLLASLRRAQNERDRLLHDNRLNQIIEKIRQLISWDPFDQNISSPFFEPEWMFGIKDNFDVVIGNPPYMRIQGIRKVDSAFADYLGKIYDSATGSFDLYVTFVEKGTKLVKEEGVLNYIMPVKWTNSDFGVGLRSFLLKNKCVSRIINFGAYQVFNASTYTGLQWFSKSDKIQYLELNKDIPSSEELKVFLDSIKKEHYSLIEYKSDDPWILTNKAVNDILRKLRENPYTLGDVFDRIFCGLQTSCDNVYFLYDTKHVEDGMIEGFSKYLKQYVVIEDTITRPLLKGEDVHKYEKLTSDRHVIFPYHIDSDKAVLYSEEEIKELFPHAYSYLKDCEQELRGREKGRLKNDMFWYRYIYPKNLTLFDNVKIVAPEISLGGNYTFDANGQYYSTTKVYGYIKKNDVQYSYEFLLGLLNSNLFWFFIQNTGYVLRGGYYTFKTNYVSPFPIPDYQSISPVDIKDVETLVFSALKLTAEGHSAIEIQNKIDKIICRIYSIDYEAVCALI